MIYLALNVLFGSAFMLLLKWTQLRQREDIIVIGALNYITAALLVLPWLITQQGATAVPLPPEQVVANSQEWNFSRQQWAAVMYGCALGGCYFTAYFFVIRAVRWVGASSTAVVGVLSILLPISVGILYWGDLPQQSQWVGMALAFVALLLIGWKREQVHLERPWFTPLVLLGFFLLAGCSRLAQEAFKHTSAPELRPLFLWSAFLVASIPSLFLLGLKRRWPARGEWLLGIFLGTANILQTLFILQALEYYPGFIVFPMSSAGGLVVTTLAAMAWLHERPDRLALLGIALAVVAVIMLY